MIQPVNALAPKVFFKGEFKGSKNPNGSRVEKNIALINSAGISTAIGAAMMAISRSYTSNWKHAGLIGMGAAAISMMFIAPRFLYKAGFNTYSKHKEVDAFVKEKKFPTKLENYSRTLVKKAV